MSPVIPTHQNTVQTSILLNNGFLKIKLTRKKTNFRSRFLMGLRMCKKGACWSGCVIQHQLIGVQT